jgi:hypothetical protein
MKCLIAKNYALAREVFNRVADHVNLNKYRPGLQIISSSQIYETYLLNHKRDLD